MSQKSPATIGDRCGTYAGAQAHKRRGEEQCPSCLRAQREYMRLRRQTSATVRQREIDLYSARERALSRLAAMHPALYQALYAEETAELVAPPRKKRERVS